MRYTFVGTSFGSLAVRVLGFALVAVAALAVFAPSAHAAAKFDPEFILSDSKLRDVDSMTQAEIQAFLDSKPGILKSMTAKNYKGKKMKASEIIYEACRAWNISPKVMLALLQKENSLITNPKPTSRALSRAIGAGCPDSVKNRYPGFGNQIWNGARMLDGYGEGKSTSYIPKWKPGTKYKASDIMLKPKNLTTFKLYVYNPVIGAKKPYGSLGGQAHNLRGNASFWKIYWRYFGDPTAAATPKADVADAAKTAKSTAPAAKKPKEAAKKAAPMVSLHRLARYEGVTFIVSQRTATTEPDYYIYPVLGEGGRLLNAVK